jgi:hypothetical protein
MTSAHLEVSSESFLQNKAIAADNPYAIPLPPAGRGEERVLAMLIRSEIVAL